MLDDVSRNVMGYIMLCPEDNGTYLVDQNSDPQFWQDLSNRTQSALNELCDWLDANSDADETAIQTQSYEIAKRWFDPKNIRRFFSYFYWFLCRENSGPRLGLMVSVMTPYSTVERIRSRIENPFGY